MLQALGEREEQELQRLLYQAWNTARLTTYSGPKLPRLHSEIEKYATIRRKPKRQQSREEMIAAMREIKNRSVH